MNNNIEALRAELEAIKPQQPNPETGASAVLTEQSISDDDPELVPYLKEPDPQFAKMFPDLFRKLSLSEAKAVLASRRRSQKLYRTVVDQARPMPERIEAVASILTGIDGWHFLKQFSPEQLIGRIKPKGSTRHYPGGVEKPIPEQPQELADVWAF